MPDRGRPVDRGQLASLLCELPCKLPFLERPSDTYMKMATNRQRLTVGTITSLILPLLICNGCYSEENDQSEEPTLVASSRIESTIEQAAEEVDENVLMQPFVPAWVKDAVFYQIFPERFRNGDRSNDPTRESLEPSNVSGDWQLSPWTGDWYARAPWEEELGNNFYDGGVFHRRYGGDLQGVLDKLDYLQKLGVNTIYFNPGVLRTFAA